MSQSRLCGGLLAGFVALRTGVFGVNLHRVDDTSKHSCVVNRRNLFPFQEFPINHLGLNDKITFRYYDNLTKDEYYGATSKNGNYISGKVDTITSLRPTVVCHYKAISQDEKSAYEKLSPDEQLKYLKNNNIFDRRCPNNEQLLVRREYNRSPIDLFSWLYIKGDVM